MDIQKFKGKLYKLKSKLNKRLLITLLLSGICLLFSYLETLIPSFGGNVAYAKITISSSIIIFTLIAYGIGEAVLVMGISALSVGLIINNSPYMILYFLLGGLFLVASVFGVLKTKKFGIIAVSVIGLIASTLGETIMSAILLGTPKAFANFPVNALFSCISGLVSGLLVYVCVRFIPSKVLFSDQDK